jgi:hypothetical protein
MGQEVLERRHLFSDLLAVSRFDHAWFDHGQSKAISCVTSQVLYYTPTLDCKLGIGEISAKQKILFIYEMKWNEILIKTLKIFPKIPLNFIKLLDTISPIFVHFSWHEWKLTKFSKY